MSARLAVYLTAAMFVLVVIFGGGDEGAPRRDATTTTTVAVAELLPPLVLERPPVTATPGSVAEANDTGDPTFVPPAPTTTATTAAPLPNVGQRWEVSSTVYCLGGTTASGEPVGAGIVAVHSSRFAELNGTRWHVVEGPPEIVGRTYTVRDHGPGAEFDVWMGDRPDCPSWGLNDYGRRRAVVVPA